MTVMTPYYNFSEFKNFMNGKTDIMNRITHIINELHVKYGSSIIIVSVANIRSGVSTTLRNSIRQCILDCQNGRCAICGIPQYWNENELHFILDHIDGDASRNDRDNLRLICPNCDNQLPTYKSRNKNSARTFRKISKE